MEQLTIDVAAIPRATRDDIARHLLEKVVTYFDQPGVEEDFQEWMKGYKTRKAAASVVAT